MWSLKGKVAVITGGTRGIGRAIAEAYAEAGADIALVARQIPEEVVKGIVARGVRCAPFEYDLSDCSGIKALVASIADTFGTIDIFLNNAGAQKRHPCVDFPENDWDYVMNVNSKAVFFLCQEVGKIMIAKGYGKIVNIASLLSFQGGLTVPAYAASKGAVMQFTKSLSNEWASLGVNVNCIAPGYIDTDLNTALINNPERSRQILERIPAGRWGKPSDIAGAALFLASAGSDYVNGIILPVDGGWLGR